MEKKSFLLYLENYEQIKLLTMEERGRLLTAIYEYELTGEAPEFTGALAMCFSIFRQRLDRNRDSYREQCEKNRQNGQKGGRPKKANGFAANQPVLKKTERFSEKPKKPDKDTDTEKDMDISPLNPPGDAEREPNGCKNGRRSAKGVDYSTTSASFERFWEAYPRKVAKQVAAKAWNKLHPNPELVDHMIAAIERQKQTQQWQKDNGDFIPHPSTWLNGRRWEDEVTDTSRKSAAPNYDGEMW